MRGSIASRRTVTGWAPCVRGEQSWVGRAAGWPWGWAPCVRGEQSKRRAITMDQTPEGLADRIPPGQARTSKWPVLTYGLTPRFDPRTWTFRCFGLVEEEVTWTWEEFLELPRTEVRCDIHCVTRWSRLDNRFEGVHIREIMNRVRLKPEAAYVMIHADP